MPRKKQENLPGVETGFPELEVIGIEYASIRDERMKLMTREVELNQQAIEAMHKHSLTTYKVEGLTMEIVPGEEKLKVRSEKTQEEEAA